MDRRQAVVAQQLKVQQPDPETLKSTNRSRAEAFNQQLRKDVEELPPEHGARLMTTMESSRARKKETLAQEAVALAEKEEKRVDNFLKRLDSFIKKEDVVATLLQGARAASAALVIQILQNQLYTTLTDTLGAVSIIGVAIDLYRNWDRDWRSIVRHEHKMKKQLKHSYRKGEGIVNHVEEQAEHAMHPVVEDLRVAYKMLAIHRFTNGEKKEAER